MYPGILVKLKSAIFRRNSIFNPGSIDQIEKKSFISILVPRGRTRVRNQIIWFLTQGFIAKVYGTFFTIFYVKNGKFTNFYQNTKSQLSTVLVIK